MALERTGHIAAASIAFEAALEADENYAKAKISLARLQDQQDVIGTETIDLFELAATFEAEPRETTEEETAADTGLESPASDMEVAAAVTEPLISDPEFNSR